MPKKAKLFFILLLFLLIFDNAWAATLPSQLSEEEFKKTGVMESKETLLGKIQRNRKEAQDHYGFNFAVVVNAQEQYIIYNNPEQEKNAKGAWYYNLEFNQKLWKDASLALILQGGKGDGVDKILPTFSMLNWNAGEPAEFYVPQVFLTQNLLNDKLSVSAGKLDLSNWFDVNNVANSSDTQFQSLSLVNGQTIPFPGRGMGAMGCINFTDWLYFQLGAADANASSTKVNLNNSFHGTFFINELGVIPKIKDQLGNYRFMFWLNGEEIERLDEENSNASDGGFALSFDQKITDKISLFCRYGLANERVRDIRKFWSFGGQLAPPFSSRKNDCLGFGVSQSIMSRDYRALNDPDISYAETMYEVYYNLQLGEFVMFVPNFQVVTHPNADVNTDYAAVGGGRVVFVF